MSGMKGLSEAYTEYRTRRSGVPTWNDLNPEMKQLIRDLWIEAHLVCAKAAKEHAQSKSDGDLAGQLEVFGRMSATT